MFFVTLCVVGEIAPDVDADRNRDHELGLCGNFIPRLSVSTVYAPETCHTANPRCRRQRQSTDRTDLISTVGGSKISKVPVRLFAFAGSAIKVDKIVNRR